MYLQITTKCNMSCLHCGYSCTMRGKHGDYQVLIDAINYIYVSNSMITIGGGEPTMHPRFFDILRECLRRFDYVWMATNGSQTKVMRRLHDILCDSDIDNMECPHDEEERDFCDCWDQVITCGEKLAVALSWDQYHDSINPQIVDLWQRKASRHKHTGYEIRTVNSIARAGRAKKNQLYTENHCLCSDFIIIPDGKIKLCGCDKAPIIGNIYNGIEDKWLDVVQNNEAFINSNCYQSLKKGNKL